MLHRKLEKLVIRLGEDIIRGWNEVGRADREVTLWAKSDIRSVIVEELSALRHEIAKIRKSTFDLKGSDPITEMFKTHDIPTLRLLASFRGCILLAMLEAVKEGGCKVGTKMEGQVEAAIKNGEDIDTNMNDAIYSCVSSAFMMVSVRVAKQKINNAPSPL